MDSGREQIPEIGTYIHRQFVFKDIKDSSMVRVVFFQNMVFKQLDIKLKKKFSSSLTGTKNYLQMELDLNI